MPAAAKLAEDLVVIQLLDEQAPGMSIVRGKRAREMLGVKHWRIHRRLHVQPKHDMGQKEFERPLVLLIAAGSAEGQSRNSITRRE